MEDSCRSRKQTSVEEAQKTGSRARTDWSLRFIRGAILRFADLHPRHQFLVASLAMWTKNSP